MNLLKLTLKIDQATSHIGKLDETIAIHELKCRVANFKILIRKRKLNVNRGE
jgi:hypothetical protein